MRRLIPASKMYAITTGLEGYRFRTKYRTNRRLWFKRDKLFSQANRIDMTWHYLQRRLHPTDTGIEGLLGDGAYSAAFPLHDGPLRHDDDAAGRSDAAAAGATPAEWAVPKRTRHELYHCWARDPRGTGNYADREARGAQVYKKVRDYFGVRHSLYFLFLDAYTLFLYVPAITGALVFMYGLLTLAWDLKDEQELCAAPEGDYTLCARCEGCKPQPLRDDCWLYKVSYVIDNELTIAFGVFMALWSITFLQYWSRIRLLHTFKYSPAPNHIGHERNRQQFKGPPSWFNVHVLPQEQR